MKILRFAPSLRIVRRIRDALSRRLSAFENSLAERIAPDQRIAGGPFAGMLYPVRNLGTSMVLPKLLGSYEEELHPEIESILQRPYSGIVDIGCGEGYYAVGFAWRMPLVHVHAFDIDPLALAATHDLAALNGVSPRVTVGKGCSAEQLKELNLGPRVLIVSDCEGAELQLLQPDTLPVAVSVDLLIECHESGGDTSVSDELRRRFTHTHSDLLIPAVARDPSKYAQLRGWNSGELDLALGESRPPGMRWLSLIQREQARVA